VSVPSPIRSTSEPHATDFETRLSQVLRVGVITSATLVAVGAAIYLARRGTLTPDYRAFRGEPADFRSVPGILRNAFALSGRGLIQLGLLVLIATPVARVVFAIIGFGRQRDWLYVVVASLVLVLLATSLFGS
jgi:uncharacterized membrane protein